MIRVLLPFADLGQAASGVINLLAFLPQIRSMLRARSATGLRLSSCTLWTTSSILALFYALTHCLVDGTGYMLLASASVSALLNLMTTLLVLLYGRSASVHREFLPMEVGKEVRPPIHSQPTVANGFSESFSASVVDRTCRSQILGETREEHHFIQGEAE
jgi:uncharacterized protein with PQ loop repeat